MSVNIKFSKKLSYKFNLKRILGFLLILTSLISAPLLGSRLSDSQLVSAADEDLYEELDERHGRKYSLNNYVGTRNRIMSFAKAGLAELFAGAPSGQVYKKEDTVKLVKFTEEEYQGMDWKGDVSFSAWCLSFADHDLLKSKNEEALTELLEEDAFIVDVTPGTYKVTYTYLLNRNPDEGYDNPVEIATLELIK